MIFVPEFTNYLNYIHTDFEKNYHNTGNRTFDLGAKLEMPILLNTLSV